jgi:hypothetical protein
MGSVDLRRDEMIVTRRAPEDPEVREELVVEVVVDGEDDDVEVDVEEDEALAEGAVRNPMSAPKPTTNSGSR